MAKYQKRNTVAEVEALVTPTLEELGFAVWDVRFEKEGPNWFLRILIDRADGETMDTDACELASRAVDPIIDEADPIEQSYFLEVGSPGLGRRLTRTRHYEACEGEAVSARFIHTVRAEHHAQTALLRMRKRHKHHKLKISQHNAAYRFSEIN